MPELLKTLFVVSVITFLGSVSLKIPYSTQTGNLLGAGLLVSPQGKSDSFWFVNPSYFPH